MDLELGAGFLIAQFTAGSLRGRPFSADEKQHVTLIASPLFRGGLEASDVGADADTNKQFLKSMAAGEGEGAAFMAAVSAEAPIKRMFSRTLKKVCCCAAPHHAHSPLPKPAP